MVDEPRPGGPFASLLRPATQPRASDAAAAVSLYVVLHAGLSLALDLAGHRPTFGALVERHYLLQAALMFVLIPLGWALFAAIAHFVAGPEGSLRATAIRLAPALYLPLVLAFVVPDIVAYLAFGFDGLSRIVRFSAPVAFCWSFALTVRAVRGRSGGRAFAGVALAYFALAIFTGAWLR